MRLKRPMVSFDIRLETIGGDHVTPLTQDIFIPTALDGSALGPAVRAPLRQNFLRTVDGVTKVLVDWLAEV